MSTRFPGTSFVVEWENAKLSEARRAGDMLKRLSKQIAALGDVFAEKPEILVLFDASEIEAQTLRMFIQESWNTKADVELRLEPSPDLEYYDQKNRGAQLATRQWLVFIDSDVVPEPDWLTHLLNARRQSNAALIGGQTYVEPARLLDRAFSLFWFFPTRSEATATYVSDRFFANNFAIDRETFLNRPFPQAQLVRGQCILLTQQIEAASESVEICPAARVSHPPPNGLLHFFKRAIIAGHDFKLMDEIYCNSEDRVPSFWRAAQRTKWNLQNTFRKIRAEGQASRPGLGIQILASCLAVAYYGLATIGELLTSINPKWVRHNFKV